MTFKESETLTAGETPTIVDTDVGRIGIGICYDIRFQELAAIYAARGAFNMTIGPLHWELLQRARAADCQIWAATENGNLEVTYTHTEEHGLITLCRMHDSDSKLVLLCSCNDNYVRVYDLLS